MIVPIVIGALGGGIHVGEVLGDVRRVFSECSERELLIGITGTEWDADNGINGSKSIVWKVVSGLVQHED